MQFLAMSVSTDDLINSLGFVHNALEYIYLKSNRDSVFLEMVLAWFCIVFAYILVSLI